MSAQSSSALHRVRTAGIILAAASLIAVATVVPATATTPLTWTPPTSMTTAGPNADRPVVTIAPNGTVTSVWRTSSGGVYALEASTSTDRGLTWSTPVAVGGAGINTELVSLVTAPDNSVTLLTSNYAGGTGIIETTRSTDGGVTWSAPIDHNYLAESPYGPTLEVAPDGSLLLAWMSSDGTDSIVAYSTSADGLTWTAPAPLGLRDANSVASDISSTGLYSLIWTRTVGLDKFITVTTSTDAGVTWTAPTDAAAPSTTAINPDISASTDGRLTAVWTGTSGGYAATLTAFSLDNGLTGSTAQELSTPGFDSNSPQIATASDNSIVVIWDRSDGSGNRVQFARSSDGGVTWTAPVFLSLTGTNANAAQLLVTPDDTIVLAWHLFNGADTVIQSLASSDGGASWEFSQLSANGNDAYSPRLAAAADNTVVAVWRSGAGSPTSIESSTTAPAAATADAALAATGVDAMPLALGSLAVLLAGIALTRRRSATN